MRSLRLALILLFLMPVHSALAHKVIASVYASGDVIEGEIGFSNGDMAPNELVESSTRTATSSAKPRRTRTASSPSVRPSPLRTYSSPISARATSPLSAWKPTNYRT